MISPTPVSALIHTTAMATAGIYLMVYSAVVFEGAPSTQTAMAVIGVITLLPGAVIGSAKDDMKKVLTTSTMSQTGYMMLRAGLGSIGYAFVIFHLLTHGFFKAQLFLGADSVIRAMGDQVNMRRSGGLRGAMMITWIIMDTGWLVVLGVPPFSGSWSKDHLIEAALVGKDAKPWTLGTIVLLGVDLTTFYMLRLLFMILHGRQHWTTKEDLEGGIHPYESGWLMTLPLIALSVFSAGLGGLPTYNDAFVTRLEPITDHAEHGEPVLSAAVIMGTTLALVVVGVLVTWWMYVHRPVPVALQPANPLVEAARRDMCQDAINEAPAIRTNQGLVLATGVVGRYVVDGAIEGVAMGTGTLGCLTRRTESGYVRPCTGYMLTETVLVLTTVLATGF